MNVDKAKKIYWECHKDITLDYAEISAIITACAFTGAMIMRHADNAMVSDLLENMGADKEGIQYLTRDLVCVLERLEPVYCKMHETLKKAREEEEQEGIKMTEKRDRKQRRRK